MVLPTRCATCYGNELLACNMSLYGNTISGLGWAVRGRDQKVKTLVASRVERVKCLAGPTLYRRTHASLLSDQIGSVCCMLLHAESSEVKSSHDSHHGLTVTSHELYPRQTVPD